MIYQSINTDGWTPAGETWTSLGGTAITSTLTMTTTYAIGDRVKFTQGGTTMYQAVTNVSGTLIFTNGGTDFVLGTTAITSPYYSHQESPVGYPQWFTYTPTVSQGTATNITKTVSYSRFSLNGREVTAIGRLDMTGAGQAGSAVNITAPLTSAYIYYNFGGYGQYYDAGTLLYNCMMQWDNSTNIMFMAPTSLTALNGKVGVNPSLAVANTDSILYVLNYSI